MKPRHVALIALPLLAATARGQATADTARVDPVIVTATRSPLDVERAPASVTVVTGAELRAQGVVHLADALRTMPGLTIAQSGSVGAPATLFVRGGQGNYTKVLIDGVPVNEPGGAFDFGMLALDDVERIEVVRGPSSVAWGSDAVSAVVHVITRRGAGNETTLTARGGTYGTGDLSGSIEGGRAGWRGAATGAHHVSNGSYGFNSAFRSSLAGGSGTWSAATGSSVRATIRHADVTAHFPTDFTGAPVDPNAYRVEGRTTASVELRQPVGPVTAVATAGHSLVVASSIDPANGDLGTSTSFDTRSRRQQLEVRAEAPLARGVLLTAGAVLERQHRTGAFNTVTTSAGEPETRDRQVNSGDRANDGLYAELLGSARATTITAGARIDRGDSYGSFATFRLAGWHALGRNTRVRGSVGTAFREPSFDEVLPSAFSTGNPDLEAERSASWELGVEQHLAAGRLVLGATYFRQRFRDMIDYFGGTWPGRYDNVAAATAGGTELEVRAAPGSGWSADASVTLVKTRVGTAGFGGSLAAGRALLRRPERSATAGLARTGTRGSVALRVAHVGRRADVRYFHDAPYSAEETLPAHTTIDLSGELPVVRRAGRQLALTLRIANVLGEEFESAAGYAAPGRAILAGARAAF